MKVLIIGDVHGHYYPFKEMIEEYSSKVDLVVQLGDLIDRGPMSKEVLDLAMELDENPNFIFLKGNHEFELLLHHTSGMNAHWYNQMGNQTLKQLADRYEHYVKWLRQRPLKYEDEFILITHAGIPAIETDYWDEDNENGVLWNRLPLKKLNKTQIHGHTPTESGHFEYNEDSNSYNIDTGMGLGRRLTGIIVKDGVIEQVIEK